MLFWFGGTQVTAQRGEGVVGSGEHGGGIGGCERGGEVGAKVAPHGGGGLPVAAVKGGGETEPVADVGGDQLTTQRRAFEHVEGAERLAAGGEGAGRPACQCGGRLAQGDEVALEQRQLAARIKEGGVGDRPSQRGLPAGVEGVQALEPAGVAGPVRGHRLPFERGLDPVMLGAGAGPQQVGDVGQPGQVRTVKQAP